MIFTIGCGQKNTTEDTSLFADEKIVKIAELQDQRDGLSLIPFLKAKKESHRTFAALAFASVQDTLAIPFLSQVLQTDKYELPRRAAALALGQIGHPKAIKPLSEAFLAEKSDTNRRYIMEAFGKCGDSSILAFFDEYHPNTNILKTGWIYGVFRLQMRAINSKKIVSKIYELLKTDCSEEFQQVAAHFFYRYYRTHELSDTSKLQEWIRTTSFPEVQKRLNLIVSQVPTSLDVPAFEKATYESASDYEKVAQIKRMENSDQFDAFLWAEIQKKQALVVRTALMEKAMQMKDHKQKNKFIDFSLENKDDALLSLASLAIIKHPNPDSAWLKIMQKILPTLKLPRQTESYLDLQKAIAHLNSTAIPSFINAFNHPIDWAYVQKIKTLQQVKIVTTQGDIIIECRVNDAPGSVVNFLKLVNSKYYDGKYFHRVVPDFVIQGGCPRGDGWGSLDWSQRTEVSNFLNYKKGAVGLASAGQDTEGVQFFITHNPTPHLDGKYTIFAQTIQGFEVIDKIKEGDKIIAITKL